MKTTAIDMHDMSKKTVEVIETRFHANGITSIIYYPARDRYYFAHAGNIQNYLLFDTADIHYIYQIHYYVDAITEHVVAQLHTSYLPYLAIGLIGTNHPFRFSSLQDAFHEIIKYHEAL